MNRQCMAPDEIYAVCKACGAVFVESDARTHDSVCTASQSVRDSVGLLYGIVTSQIVGIKYDIYAGAELLDNPEL